MSVPLAQPGRQRVALARRILAFSGAPFLSLVAPFFILPVISRLSGEAWVAIAVGQSVGGFAALLAGMGYPTLAPPVLAAASAQARRRYVATSLHVRAPVWVIAAAIAGLVAAMVVPSAYAVEAAATAAALSLAGLAPTWYWIGVGKASPIIWTEVVPRAAATALASGALLLGGSLLWYPSLLAVAMIAGPAAVYSRIARGEWTRVRRQEVAAVVRHHPPAVVAETAAGAYNALAVTLVSHVATVPEAARYVSGDKSYRVGQYGVMSMGNALQGWAVERGDEGVGRRMRAVLALHGALGAAGLVGFALLGPDLTRFIFGADVAITRVTAIGFGVAVLGISLGTACGRIGLIMMGARHAFMTCVVVASVVGATSLLWAGHVWGATGAAWALGSTELASGVAQALLFVTLWRRRRRAGMPLLVGDRGASA